MSDENELAPNTVVVAIGRVDGRGSLNVDTASNVLSHFKAHFDHDHIPPESQVARLGQLRFCTVGEDDLKVSQSGRSMILTGAGTKTDTNARRQEIIDFVDMLKIPLQQGYHANKRPNPFTGSYGDWRELCNLVSGELQWSNSLLLLDDSIGSPNRSATDDSQQTVAFGGLSRGSWLHNLFVHGGHFG